MNQVNQNGLTILQYDDHMIINGERIEIPKQFQGKENNSLTLINGELTINGFKFDLKEKKFIDHRTPMQKLFGLIKG